MTAKFRYSVATIEDIHAWQVTRDGVIVRTGFEGSKREANDIAKGLCDTLHRLERGNIDTVSGA